MNLKINILPEAELIICILNKRGYAAHVVGGCVRDSLLGIKPHDWDICTDAKPEKVRDIFTHEGFHVIETGIQHGTVTIHLGIRGDYEITTYRIDGEYSDNRRPDTVIFTDDITKDLSRRDFTINAMAYSDDSDLIDPFGGQEDLELGVIRCVGNPDDRFQEDALRILRALRFAATYGFRIEEKTAAAIHRNKDLLKNISAERIRSELCKLLCGEGVLDILMEYKDVMAVIIPELEPCIGFWQNNPYHVYDVYDHIAHAVANYRGPDISIKMALLLHDIGKPECYSEDENGGHFYGHSVPSMDIAKDVMDRLKFDNKTKQEVVDLVLYHDIDIYPGARTVKRWLNKIGYEMLDKLINIKGADNGAQSEMAQISRPLRLWEIRRIASDIMNEQQCFQIKDLAVDGRDMIGVGFDEGPGVGKVLNHLLDKVIDGALENDRGALMEEASVFYHELLSGEE